MKRVLAVLLAAVMALTMAPGMVFAAGEDAGTADGKELTEDMVVFSDAEDNPDAVYGLSDWMSEVTPTVIVCDGEVPLREDRDYSVVYENNKQITDAAKVIVSGEGNYSGRIEKTFKIVKTINIAGATVTMDIPEEGLFYNAKAQEPAIKEVSLWDGTKLTADDYEVTEYCDNVDAGHATVNISGKGIYEGMATGGFEIQKLPVKKLTLEINKTETVYDGQTQKPEITQVKANDSVILAEKDYWVVYKKNTAEGWTEIYDGDVRAAGDYTVAARVDSNLDNCVADWLLSEEKAYKIKPVSVAGQKVTLRFSETYYPNSMLDAGDVVSADISRVTPGSAAIEDVKYQWKMNGKDIPNANRQDTSVGDWPGIVMEGDLTCVVTFTGSTTGTIVSEPLPTGKRLLTGEIEIHEEDGTLIVSTPSNEDVTASDYKITWYRNGVLIEGEHGKEYKVKKPQELGNTFAAVITGIGDWGGTLYTNPFTEEGDAPETPKITARAGDQRVTLSWKRPEENGSPMKEYKLTVKNAATNEVIKETTIGADKTDYTVDGLQNGTEYAFTMIAVNYRGDSQPSEEVKATPKIPDTYPITYISDGKTITVEGNPDRYEEGSEAIPLRGLEKRTGYDFVGWYTDKNFAENTKMTEIPQGSTGAITLYAKWTANKHKITYENVKGAQNSNPTEFTYGTAAIPLEKPTKTGYTFDGWYTSKAYEAEVTQIDTTTDQDLVLWAKWTANKHKITYENVKGAQNSNPTEFTYGAASTTLKKLTRTGYTFDGWYTSKAYETEVTQIDTTTDQDLVLWAKWTPKTYKITYRNLCGATTSNPKTYTYGTGAITLNTKMSRKGYTFDGWYTSSSYKTKVTRIYKNKDKDQAVYAKWKKVTVAKAKTPVLTNLKGRSLKISYGPTTGAKGYEIQYTTNKKFPKAGTKTATTKAKTYTAKKLQKGKTYYVRVRAYKMDSKGYKVYGSWSTVKSKKITK